MKKILIYVCACLLVLVSACDQQKNKNEYGEWRQVHGNASSSQYSSLTQIDTTNVNRLQVAWVYHTGDADTANFSQIQCNPIIVNGVLYGTTPQLRLFAINAATGKQIWVYSPYDSITEDKSAHFNLNNNRGVAYWTDGKNDERIFYTAGPFLQAIDAKTGKLITNFGTNGKIDLHDGLGDNVSDLFVTSTSAPAVYKNFLITGTRVSEGMDAAPGHIRAYDIITGKQQWIFHTIPQPGEPGYETWEDPNAWKMSGGANNWTGMTIDQERGIAFIPTGSASMDFYGGKRRGNDLYADCLLAIDASTGKLRWHYQYIHHDTWDWDQPSPPVLVTLTLNGQRVDAVVQTSKTGFVWVFNRETGEPLFPVQEVQVDTATQLVGEKMWPTQPVPQKPLPFVRQTFTEKDINPYLTKEEIDTLKQKLTGYHTGRMFTPQSREGTIIFPGFDGGSEWGGPAIDPETGMLYVNANEMAWILKMIDIKAAGTSSEDFGTAGLRLYKQNCMSCHGADRKGSGNFPSIADINKKYNEPQFIAFINNGRRMMPAFHHLKDEDKAAIASYVLALKDEQKKPYVQTLTARDSFRTIPFTISGYNKFVTASGKPALSPPWGTLSAIDLNTGEHVWKQVLGNDTAFHTPSDKPTGTENYGGPVVTKGGLLFIAATKDAKFRAYNKRTGQLLWETALPAAGFATPSVYEIDGKQFVVIACGGGKLKTKSSDAYVAFALP